MITLKRGDVVRSRSGSRLIVSYIKRRDDAEDRVKLWSPEHRVLLSGSYTEADIKAGVITPTGEWVDMSGSDDG